MEHVPAGDAEGGEDGGGEWITFSLGRWVGIVREWIKKKKGQMIQLRFMLNIMRSTVSI